MDRDMDTRLCECCEEEFQTEEDSDAELCEECEYEDDRTAFDMSDDADALASAGWGTDEDYGYYGGED